VTNTLFEAFSLYLKFLFFSLMFFFWVTKGKKERKKKKQPETNGEQRLHPKHCKKDVDKSGESCKARRLEEVFQT
jgi:hypothetical protein